MFKKLPVKLIVILFCIAYLNSKTLAYEAESRSTQIKLIESTTPPSSTQIQSSPLADSVVEPDFLLPFIPFAPITLPFHPPNHSKIPTYIIEGALRIGKDVIIDSCMILGPLWMEGRLERPDSIKSYMTIRHSVFTDSISFINCYFLNEVTLSENSFNNSVGFFYVIFRNDVNFQRCTFKDLVSFKGTFFSGFADFTGSIFLGKVVLDLIEFKNIQVTWAQLKSHLVYLPVVYFKLMKSFEENRQLEDADDVYLFLKDKERMKKPWYIRYPEYWLFQLPCGYGVKPLNTVYLSIVIILLFALFYTKPNSIKEIEKEFLSRRHRKSFRDTPKSFKKRFYYALYFSVHTFIIGIVADWHPTDEFLINTSRINLFRFRAIFRKKKVSDWYPTEEYLISSRRIKLFRFRTLAMIEGALGWILLVLLVVTLTRKFIR